MVNRTSNDTSPPTPIPEVEWEWLDETRLGVTGNSPSPRSRAVMAYTGGDNAVLLYGGLGQGGVWLNDVHMLRLEPGRWAWVHIHSLSTRTNPLLRPGPFSANGLPIAGPPMPVCPGLIGYDATGHLHVLGSWGGRAVSQPSAMAHVGLLQPTSHGPQEWNASPNVTNYHRTAGTWWSMIAGWVFDRLVGPGSR